MTSLLEQRNKLKKRKPEFQRQDFNVMSKFEGVWRRPRGMHSKMRRNKDGQACMPSIGYSSPCAVKNLDAKGLRKVTVRSLNDLQGLDAKKDVIIIASAVGNKLKIKIINRAKELGLKVKNFKDADKFVAKLVKEREERRQERNKKVEGRKKSKEESLKKKKEEKEKEEKKKAEDKKTGVKDEPVK